MLHKLWLWLFFFALRKIKPGAGACANRRYMTFGHKAHRVRVEVTDTRKPDGYSREELYEMLKIIRAAEKRSGWKCPEPKNV